MFRAGFFVVLPPPLNPFGVCRWTLPAVPGATETIGMMQR